MSEAPVLSLTQVEAEERGALIEVERYDIEVDLTDLPSGPEVRCRSRITFSARTPGSSTFVDCAARVVAAQLNGADLPAAEDGRIALVDLAAHNELVVESVQAETTDGLGVHKATDPADGQVYAWTTFEPDEARYVWACFDQPDLKAPHAFAVTAPESWTVLSNTGEAEVEPVTDPEGRPARRWTFAPTPPLSTYNPVVLAGPFHEVRREVGDHDLGLYARQSLAALIDRDADELFEVTAQGLDFYGEVFGLPFPQRRYDQVFLPEFGGAMENYGCVAWSDAFLTRTPPTPAEMDLFVRVLLHEMAHMWFGNIVTMRWWDDLWLNEAFAEFACNWAMVRATRYTDAWAGHLATGKLRAYLADQGPRSHAIRRPVPDVAAAAASFDAITYPKGASVLAQLMTYLGEETFEAGMTAYFARHAWGNTTLQDLMDDLASTSGRDLDRWRHAWLEDAGVDLLVVEQDDGDLGLVATGPDGSDTPRPHTLRVGAYADRNGTLERVAVADVELSGRRTPLDLPDGADLYLANDDDLTFARTRPGAGSREALFERAAELPTPESRGVAVASVWDMLTDGEATAAEAVAVLTDVLRVETAPVCVEPYLGLAVEAADLWSTDAQRGELTEQVAGVARELAELPERRTVALRALAHTTSDVEEVSRLLADSDDVDLQWRLLQRQAQLTGTADLAAAERLQDSDPDPESWVRALAMRAAAPTAEDKAAAWQAMAVDHSVPVSSIGTVARAFWSPGQDELLAPYADRYLEVLPELGRRGLSASLVETHRLFPVFGVDEAFLDRAVTAGEAAVPTVRAELTERADEVRRMLRARSL